MLYLTSSQRNIPVLTLWHIIALGAQHAEAFHQFDARLGRVDHIVYETSLSCNIWVGVFLGVFSH